MWACHWLFTVLNPIILLNLLISLLGDTFKRLNDNVEIADAIEIVDLIIETESMMFWKRDKGIKEYLQICTSVENLEEFDNETEKKLENLRGQVNNLEEKVNRLHKGRLRRLDEAIKFGKKNNLNQSRFSNKE